MKKKEKVTSLNISTADEQYLKTIQHRPDTGSGPSFNPFTEASSKTASVKGGCQEATLKEGKQGAKAEKKWTENHWEQVLWSDESKSKMFGLSQYVSVYSLCHGSELHLKLWSLRCETGWEKHQIFTMTMIPKTLSVQ